MIASETVSRLCRSRAVCQPGLYSRLPRHAGTRAARSRSFARPSRARCISSSRRTMPTRSCIISCRSCWIWYGPSSPPGARTAPAPSAPPPRPGRRGPGAGGVLLGVLGRELAGPLAEDQQVGQRIAAQPIGAVDARGALAAGEQARHARHLRLGVDAHAAHDVVRGRADLHRLLGDVDVAQLLELVVHAGQLALDVLGRVGRSCSLIQAKCRGRRRRAGCRGPRLHLAEDAAGHVVARQQLRRAGWRCWSPWQ